MGWYGNWNIKYNGKDSDKFVNLAKMIIPNYVKRFEETEKGVLDCKRSLSWYNADVDISKMMEYLDENDTIDVEIDGETHPISGTRKLSEEEAEWEEYAYENDGEWYVDDEYDCENQTFKKENGQVVIDNEHPDGDRYTSSNLGVQEMLTYYLAYPENAKESELEGNTDTVDSYINYIAQELAGNDEIMPAVQDFIYNTFDPQKLKDLTNEEYNYFSNRITPDEKTLARIASIRERFRTVESTKAYLEQVKEQNPEVEKQNEKYTKTAIEKNVLQCLDQQETILGSNYYDQNKDLSLFILTWLYGYSQNARYKIEPQVNIIKKDHYQFREFIIRRVEDE